MRKSRETTKYIVVHCSATQPSRDIGVKEIDDMHKARGWQGIGYHLVIRRNGIVESGENLNSYGAHVKGHNYHSVGVCLIGGIDNDGKSEDNFTDEQFRVLRSTLDWLQFLYPTATILGHRDLSPDQDGDGKIEAWEFMKDCPCFDVQAWRNNNR